MKQIFTMIMALLTGAVGISVLGLGVQSVEGMPLDWGKQESEETPNDKDQDRQWSKFKKYG